ncbi:MAG: ExeM/NucH family extracellular endonuclease, partial [Thermoflexales bacterium]|nr:ExeM/NucH family extracellular endonuclease [Thermoflexales bacterium]
GPSSPLIGQSVTIEGVVVGDFQAATQQSGFYLQDPVGDGNPATSDGVFVYSGSPDVNVGEIVRVTGTVVEFNELTEISPVTNVQVCSNGQPLAPIVVDLPVAATNDQERFEGMYVTVPETLTVDQNFFQGRYGQVTLSADGRMYNPTNGNGLGDTAELNARRMLVLDDGSTAQNPNPVPYLGVDNTLRAGDIVTNLTGVIDYGAINSNAAIRHYRLQPIGPVTISRAHPRTAAPEAVGGSIRVASFNVLNYFNGDGAGGGFPTSRGADTYAEFVRQRDKIIPAIVALNADVVGLMEIENDGTGTLSAIQDLVNGLNAATSAGTYAFVTEPAPGSDAIKVAMIYQTARVSPQGAPLNHQVITHPVYNPLFDRPPLAQRFRTPQGEEFFVIVNHFKSKGSCPASGVDIDLGQGCWNVKRTAQANGLVDWITTLQATDPDVIVIGDLNAYGAEDPINALVSGGLVNQALHVTAAQRYSYVFDGQAGYLDQALTTSSLDPHITGVTYWHINADEPSVIDYDQDFNPPGLYTPTPYRASDHDPVLIGLEFGTVMPANVSASFSANTSSMKPGEVITFTFTLTNSGGLSATVWLTPTLDARYFTLSDALDFTPSLTWTGVLSGSAGRSVQYAARVNDLGQLPVGAATLDNAALWAVDVQAASTLTAPTTIHVYGVYLPLISN